MIGGDGGGGGVEENGEFVPVSQLQPSLPCTSTVIDGLRRAQQDRHWASHVILLCSHRPWFALVDVLAQIKE